MWLPNENSIITSVISLASTNMTDITYISYKHSSQTTDQIRSAPWSSYDDPSPRVNVRRVSILCAKHLQYAVSLVCMHTKWSEFKQYDTCLSIYIYTYINNSQTTHFQVSCLSFLCHFCCCLFKYCWIIIWTTTT